MQYETVLRDADVSFFLAIRSLGVVTIFAQR